jgi:hypothetical protein
LIAVVKCIIFQVWFLGWWLIQSRTLEHVLLKLQTLLESGLLQGSL